MDERALAVRREGHLGPVVPQGEAFEQLVAEPRHRLERDDPLTARGAPDPEAAERPDALGIAGARLA